MNRGEILATEVPAGPAFELLVNDDLEGFSHVEITEYTPVGHDAHLVPKTVDVYFPDGDILAGIPANEPAFVLRPLQVVHGVDLVLTIERAQHVQYLHIDGQDSGSTFLEGTTLQSLLSDLCEHMPREASEENYTKRAVGIDMGRPYGWENLSHIDELVKEGIATQRDIGIIEQYHRAITEVNRKGEYDDKVDFVQSFNAKVRPDGIFLRVIREPDGVIVPHAIAEPHLTQDVMVALSTRYGEAHKKIHTITPGREMGRHPIPGEHYDPRLGRVNNRSFRASAWNWTHHVLLVQE